MTPIHGQTGEVVAWLKETNIYHLDGQHAALLNGNNVYGHHGQQLGVFTTGFFRDHSGEAVAFVKGATDGPVTPETHIPPFPSYPSIPPIPVTCREAKVPVAPKSSWGKSWKEFFEET